MNALITPLVLCMLAAGDAAPTPKLPVGKDTTIVTGPIDKEGYIDFEAALNDRLSKGIVPDKNANVLLWKALGPTPERGAGMPADFFKRLGIEAPPQEGAYYIGLDAYLRKHAKLNQEDINSIFDQQYDASQRPWSAKNFPHIADWLKANEAPLALVVEATRRPDYYNPMVSRRSEKEPGSLIAVLLPGAQKCRDFANALSARAMLRVSEGKFDEAWQDLLACHRLGRLVGRGATLIESLVGIAIEQIASEADLSYLERAKLTAKQLQERRKALQDLPPRSPLADKIDLGERFMYLDSVQLIRRGGIGALEGLTGKGEAAKQPTPAEVKAMDAVDWTPTLRNGNVWYDRLAAALRLQDRADRDKELRKIEEDLRALKKEASGFSMLAQIFVAKSGPGKAAGKAIGDVLISLLMPATTKVQNAFDRAEQVERNLHIALALAGYKLEHKRFPAKLDDLAPKHLPAVPGDLFTGKSLLYRPMDKGYLLYSVGVNGKDEEGRWYDDTPPGDDPRVRMPLPELKKR